MKPRRVDSDLQVIANFKRIREESFEEVKCYEKLKIRNIYSSVNKDFNYLWDNSYDHNTDLFKMNSKIIRTVASLCFKRFF